ncbi:CdaR family transcriptional regulator [Fredinandcohnia humi]
MLIPSLAKKIIQEVRRLIDEDIIIVDTSGTIIASTDPMRLGNFHEGALLSIRDQTKMIITRKMEETLQGVKAGINLPILFQHRVVGVIGITGDPALVSPYGELLKKMTELLIQESYYAEQIELNARSLEAFVFDWLQMKEPSSEFYNRAELLGIDIEAKRQIVMGHIRCATQPPLRELTRYLKQNKLASNNTIYVRWGNDRFLLMVSKQPKQQLLRALQEMKSDVETEMNVIISFGIGKEVPGSTIRTSFNEAERALYVAKLTSSIQFEDELKMEILLQEIKEDIRMEFVHRTIGELLKDKVHLETLQSFINQNQSIKQTAEALHIHVNTLHYRLHKIEELTGLNPRKFADLSTLYIGLQLEEYPKKSS